jgi:hypothetical protein
VASETDSESCGTLTSTIAIMIFLNTYLVTTNRLRTVDEPSLAVGESALRFPGSLVVVI